MLLSSIKRRPGRRHKPMKRGEDALRFVEFGG